MFDVTMRLADQTVYIAIANPQTLSEGIALPGARMLRDALSREISRADQIIEAGIVTAESNGVVSA